MDNYKRRLPEMLPTVAGVLEQMCMLEGNALKGINDEKGIQSFTELFAEDLYYNC
jgi:hypothetical protein